MPAPRPPSLTGYLSCFLSPRTGQKRTDHCLQPLLEREVSDQFADTKIQHPQPERAEHREGFRTVPGRGPASENVGQGTPDEFPVTHPLLRHVHYGLDATDVITTCHDVARGQHRPWS